MKPITLFLTAVAATLSLCAHASGGLISAEAAGVAHASPAKSADGRGRQLATLKSYLMPDLVTVGVDPSDDAGWQTASIKRGIKVWTDALPDCPFVLAQPGQKPMVVVRFVDSIESGGDIQGQVEATRYLHWGSSVSYRIAGKLLVRKYAENHELQEDELSEVVAHELGHVLGLDDAEECVGLMGPFVPGHARLKPSREEVEAVTDYRQQLRDAIAKLGNRP